ncbi:MAG: hypothetical protein ABJG47_10990 [Ekhidna sp.]
MPKEIMLSHKLTEHLEHLLTASPPAALRKSLLRVNLQYIVFEHETLPSDFESIACDFQLLIEFFTQAEELMS